MSNEWYTPSKYIEAAREVMGSIDLDPASCELANQTVRATRYYTQEDNGFIHPWYGNVWCNPPYGKLGGISNKELWSKKIVDSYEDGYVEQAILLVTASTESMWFQPLWNYPICFSLRSDRVRFFSPEGSMCEHPHGTAFVYFGDNEQRFTKVFSQFGRIAKAIDTPAVKPRQLELVS